MTPTAQKWAEKSKYDMETARAMLASERYLYVLFCCQQALEKALKAVIVEQTSELPPRIHNLLRLAEEAKLELASDVSDFLGDVSGYYIQTRYPEEMESMAAEVEQEMAEEALRRSEELTKWLFSMLK